MSSWIWLVSAPSQPPDESHPNGSTDLGADTSNVDEPDLSQRAASGEEVAVSIRAHWARCHARAERYEEEAELTLEEMRRTLEFFKWRSRWWLELQDGRAVKLPDPQVEHGLRAYAHRQASIYTSLVDTYVNHWKGPLIEVSLGLEWLNSYLTTSPPAAELIPPEGTDGSPEDDEDEPDSDDPINPEFEEQFSDF